MEIITITNQKGGVGKTTTAHHLAVGLKKRGYKVLLIDADQQGNLTYSLNSNYTATIYDVIKSQVSTENEVAIKDVICQTPQCDIIAGDIRLSKADLEFVDTGKEYLFREALEPLKNDYDYIIIDTPPTLGILTVNALTCSDSVIIPAQADIFSLQGFGQLYKLINTVKKYTNPKLTIKGVLLTKYNDRTILNRQLKQKAQEISKNIETNVFNSTIREATSIREAQTNKLNVFDYDSKSKVAKDYNSFVDEFLKY